MGPACLLVAPACPARVPHPLNTRPLSLFHACSTLDARCSTLLAAHSVNTSLWCSSCHFFVYCCFYRCCDSCTCHSRNSVVLAGQAVLQQSTTSPTISSANTAVLSLAIITPQLPLAPAICTLYSAYHTLTVSLPQEYSLLYMLSEIPALTTQMLTMTSSSTGTKHSSHSTRSTIR